MSQEDFGSQLTDRYRLTTGKWIAGVTLYTPADRDMIMNSAISVQAAGARTGILTSLANASLIARTISGNDALGTAVWRCTDVIKHTRARRITINIATLRIGSTRRGYARVRGRTRQRSS